MDLPHGHGHSSNSSLPSAGDRGQHPPRQRPFSLPHTPSPVAHSRSESNLSTNQRRLNVRNDKFRASQFSAQSISATFSRIFHGQEEQQSVPAADRSRENRPPSYRSVRSRRSNDTLKTPLGILHELTNSTRNRQSLKRPAIPVFEDEPERPLLEASPHSPESVYHDASSPAISPALYAFAHIDSGNMRLREVSGNELRSPSGLSSPLTWSVKNKKIRSLNLRKSSFDAVHYIEALEKELSATKAEQYSPNSGKSHVEKLRLLQSEYNQMEAAFRDLEHHFEDRIKEAMEHKTAVEAALRRKIKELEELVEEKDSLIQELEYDHEESRHAMNIVDTLRATVERLELENKGLEESNRGIERRNEVLTELLAFSPTKSLQTFELSSPVRDGARRNTRPRSMLIPRLPTSPSIGHSSRPQSLLGSPALSACSFSPVVEEPVHFSEVNLHKGARDNQSIDSGLGESCSAPSAMAACSRRSTLASQESTSPSKWGFPLPGSPLEDKATIKQPPRRKPRRFMSGSTQLKTLLLPTITADSGHAQNSFSFSQLQSPGRRNISEESMDPTISFLSHSFDDFMPSPCQSPWIINEPETMSEKPFKAYPPPFETVYDDDLMGFSDSITSPLCRDNFPALLGLPDKRDPPASSNQASTEDVTALLKLCHPNDLQESSSDSAEQVAQNLCDYHIQKHEDHETLQTLDLEMPAADLSAMKASPHIYTPLSQDISNSGELRHPDLPLPAERNHFFAESDVEGSDLYLSLLNSVKNSPTPNTKKRRKLSYSPDDDSLISSPSHSQVVPLPSSRAYVSRKVLTPTSVHNKTSALTLSSSNLCLERQPSVRPKPSRCSRNPLEMLQKKGTGPRPLASVTIQTIYGTLSRYTTYIREIKRDPMALARRVIANAWCNNWKRLGKLSWWVLGLFLGKGAKRDFGERLTGTTADWDDYDGESIAERVQQNKESNGLSPNKTLKDSSRSRKVRFDETSTAYRTNGNRSPAQPALKNGKHEKNSWSKSIFLWGKFSIAILLAVGGAVVKGPGAMMKDCDQHTKPPLSTEADPTQSPRPIKTATPTKSSLLNSPKRVDIAVDCRSVAEHVGCDDFFHPDLPNVEPPGRDKANHLQPSLSETYQTHFIPPASAPTSRVFIFGSPCANEGWDRFDDNGSARPSHTKSEEYKQHCVGRKASRRPYDPESPAYGRNVNVDCKRAGVEHLGNLKWMQTLGLSDFADFGVDENEHQHGPLVWPKPQEDELQREGG